MHAPPHRTQEQRIKKTIPRRPPQTHTSNAKRRTTTTK
jgi:hypothetical protein